MIRNVSNSAKLQLLSNGNQRTPTTNADLGVEGRAHDVVVVARQHRDAGAALPIPDADGLANHSSKQAGRGVGGCDSSDTIS